MDDRELMFERIRGAQTIIPSTTGYDHARAKALEIAAFMAIIEGKELSQQEFLRLEREFREEESKPKLKRRRNK